MVSAPAVDGTKNWNTTSPLSATVGFAGDKLAAPIAVAPNVTAEAVLIATLGANPDATTVTRVPGTPVLGDRVIEGAEGERFTVPMLP